MENNKAASQTVELTHESILQRVHDFILTTFPHARQKNIDAKSKLFEHGIVDSLGLIEILSFIEQSFGLTVGDEDVLVENFDSIDSIANYVKNATGY